MSTINSLLLAYDVPDGRCRGPDDRLVEDIKQEIDVKPEYELPFDAPVKEEVEHKHKKKEKKSKHKNKTKHKDKEKKSKKIKVPSGKKRGRPRKYPIGEKPKYPRVKKPKPDDIEDDNLDETTADGKKRRKKRRFLNRKTIIIRRMPKQVQILPEVKEAVYSVLLCGEEGSLGCVKYKDVPISREAYDKGYTTRDEDMDRFKEEKDEIISFNCEDCDYYSLYRSAFKTHFIMHANVFLLMDTLNRTAKTYYCYLCEKPCKSDAQLQEHLHEHWDKVREMRLNLPKTEDHDAIQEGDVEQPDIGNEPEEEIDSDDQTLSVLKLDIKKSPKWEIEDNFVDANSAFDDDLPFFDDLGRNDTDEEDESKYEPKVIETKVDDKPVVTMDIQFDEPKEVKKKDKLSKKLKKNRDGKISKHSKKDGSKSKKDKSSKKDHSSKKDFNSKSSKKDLDNKSSKKYVNNEMDVDCHQEVDDKKDMAVVIKKEIEENEQEDKNGHPITEVTLDNLLIKLEKDGNLLVDDENNKKCPYCKYEAKIFPLSQHKCHALKGIRKCDICGKVLFSQRVFRYHRKSHFCEKCPFKSVDLKEVTKHKRESLACWSSCPNCDFKTMSQESFERHVRTKTCYRDRNLKMEKSSYFFYCDFCSYRTFYKPILEKHISKHNSCTAASKDSFLCDICQKACFSRTTQLAHHKSHFCGKCDYMSNYTSDVLKHRKANPDCMFKCDICDFTSSHKISLKRHQKHFCGKNVPTTSEDGDTKEKGKIVRMSKSLSCDSCAYRTNSKSFLEMHIRKHLDPKPYQCSKCDFKCSQKGNLQIHEKKHIEGKSYCCNLCNYQCSRFKVYQMHKKTHGIDVENSPGEPVKESNRDPGFLYCEKCEFRTKYPQYLKNHAMKHENVRPHLCPFCGITFVSLIDYHVHKKNAHNTEPQKIYKCSYCDYSYSKKATVMIHERKHTGVKPHKCEFCSYSTNYSGNLQAHRKKHMNLNPRGDEGIPYMGE